MDFTWVKRKDCKVLLQDSTLVGFNSLTISLDYAKIAFLLMKINIE
ncbi:MAG: hypothetical protein RLZZ176_1231 [Cyanobacteriota bacterium]